MKLKTFGLYIFLLFAIDTIIKVVIKVNYMDLNFEIIPDLFYFQPVINTKFSYANHIFNWGLGYWAHIFMNIIAFLVPCILYCIFWSQTPNKKSIDITFGLGIAASICNLSNLIAWGGALDYIYLKPLFIFDLKDLYIDAYLIAILYHCIKNREMLGNFKLKDIPYCVRNRLENSSSNPKKS